MSLKTALSLCTDGQALMGLLPSCRTAGMLKMTDRHASNPILRQHIETHTKTQALFTQRIFHLCLFRQNSAAPPLSRPGVAVYTSSWCCGFKGKTEKTEFHILLALNLLIHPYEWNILWADQSQFKPFQSNH